MELWGCPWASWRDLLVRHLQHFMDRRLGGIQDVGGRIHVLLTPSESPIYLASLPTTLWSSWFNSLDRVREKWERSFTQLGKSSTPSHALTFFMGKITGQDLSWPWTMPPWGRIDVNKIKLFYLPSPVCPNSHFFDPLVCWNFSTGDPDLNKVSLVCGWLSQTANKLLLFLCQEGLELWFVVHCRVHSWDWGPYASYPHMIGWDSSRVFWCRVLDPAASTKVRLSMDGCQIVVGWRHEWGYLI